MNNESIGAGTILMQVLTHLAKWAGWANDNIIVIGLWLSAIGAIMWIIANVFKSRADNLAARKAELEIEKLERELDHKRRKGD
jgi:hypothetical protein